jgi:glycosyltransferase involved in cell wall biosynthesis
VKKILYISYDGMTDPLGQSQVLPYLTLLAAKGFQFTLLSFEKKERYAREGNIIQEIVNKAGIKWVPLFFTKNPPVLSKIYDRWVMKKKVRQLHRERQFDMTHCRSYIAAETGLQLKKKYGVKFLFDMRGFWADEKVDSGQWKQTIFFFKTVYKFYKKKEKDFLLNADGIVSLTEAAKNEIYKNKDYKNLFIHVIPCCVDLAHFDFNKINGQDAAALKSKLGIQLQKKVITYLGSVGGWYMTGEMFSFFNRLLQKDAEFVMLVLTKDNPDKVKAEALQYGIMPEKIIVQYAGRLELPVYLSISDFSIFFIRPTYSKIASSPTKHAELMGMGIPVICNSIGDTGNIITKTKTGLVVNKFDHTEYDDIINHLPELFSITKEHIRESAFTYFDLKKGVESYLELYKRVLAE